MEKQLRVGLSQLNFHKFQHNFKDTVDALCPISDGIEDTEHFLLYCDSFKEPRRDLLADVETVFQANNLNSFSSCNKTELLLYGHKSLSFQANRTILELTIAYIFKTGRFN